MVIIKVLIIPDSLALLPVLPVFPEVTCTTLSAVSYMLRPCHITLHITYYTRVHGSSLHVMLHACSWQFAM